MELDRQAIERRDFPISRRGYDPSAVDAHLRALAAEIEQLQRSAGAAADESLAASAGSQVQGILAAAESAAAEIERSAREAAEQTRAEADSDAEQTRTEAIEKARAHVAAVGLLAATLLERVGGMDTEVRALIETLRSGASRLATDLSAIDANMGELYDAASGTRERSSVSADADAASRASRTVPTPRRPPAAPAPPSGAAAPGAGTASDAGVGAGAASGASAKRAGAKGAVASGDVDLDGARLVALNMALNGDSRADTERYLAENFELPDRGALVEEVYAAIEG